MKQKGSVLIVLLIVAVVLLAAGGYAWYYSKYNLSRLPGDTINGYPADIPASYTTQTVGTTTIVTISDPAVESAGWVPASNATSTLVNGGLAYRFKTLSSPCMDEDGGTACDRSLVVATNETTTVLIPSVFKVISADSNTIPPVVYFIGLTKSQLLFEANHVSYKGSTPIGIYSFNLDTKKVLKVPYAAGVCNNGAGAGSPYIVDFYIGSTTAMNDVNGDKMVFETIKAFNMIDNATVYSQSLTPPQGIAYGGMGCQAFYGEGSGSDTFYKIVNQADYAPISTVELKFP